MSAAKKKPQAKPASDAPLVLVVDDFEDNRAMYVGIIVVAIVGVLFSELVRFIGRLMTPWAPDRRGPGGT